MEGLEDAEKGSAEFRPFDPSGICEHILQVRKRPTVKYLFPGVLTNA